MSTTSHFQSMACRCGAYKEAHLKLGCFLHKPKSLHVLKSCNELFLRKRILDFDWFEVLEFLVVNLIYSFVYALKDIKAHQNTSKIIKAHQSSSKLIKAHQSSSKYIKTHQNISNVIKTHQNLIKTHQNSSKLNKTHQNSSKHIKTHQNSSKLIKTHQN